jgi:hypothetical protein
VAFRQVRLGQERRERLRAVVLPTILTRQFSRVRISLSSEIKFPVPCCNAGVPVPKIIGDAPMRLLYASIMTVLFLAPEASPVSAADAVPKKIRAVLWIGGHSHDFKAYADLLAGSVQGVRVSETDRRQRPLGGSPVTFQGVRL